MNRKILFLQAKVFLKSSFWFLVGVILGIFFVGGFSLIFFERLYSGKIIPGVFAGNINLGSKTKIQIENYFNAKNYEIKDSKFVFYYKDQSATISAQNLNIGYDSNLIADQAYSVGRSKYIFSDIYNIINSYVNGTFLKLTYTFKKDQLKQNLNPLIEKLNLNPVNAKFIFQNGKVTTFKTSADGQAVNLNEILNQVEAEIPYLLNKEKNQTIKIEIPIVIVKPKITTDNANNLGIKEFLGSGTSLFQHSIESRIYNIELASSRINGTLIAPNQVFSFDQTLGNISAFTGYKQAYVIQNGHTVLGDGGGVCQVSTTLFRAILNSGLPIVERHAHAYRVGYYEEDSPPGLDATIYVPTVDLKFKNDTNHYILIEEIIDPNTLRLTFSLYGASDGRTTQISTPSVINQTPPPPAQYTNDPNLPKGFVKQTDFAAWGANVSFTRTVKKDNRIYIQDTYKSDYQPWQAQYLVGTGN